MKYLLVVLVDALVIYGLYTEWMHPIVGAGIIFVTTLAAAASGDRR